MELSSMNPQHAIAPQHALAQHVLGHGLVDPKTERCLISTLQRLLVCV